MGSSRLYTLHNGDEIIVEGLSFEQSCFLLLLAFLRPSTGALIVVGWRLAFASFVAEESTDRFLSYSIVCHHVH